MDSVSVINNLRSAVPPESKAQLKKVLSLAGPQLPFMKLGGQTLPNFVQNPGLLRRVEIAAENLPDRPEMVSDVYFLRSWQILATEQINPWVGAQYFARKPGKFAGIDRLIAILWRFSSFFENGGRVYSVPDGYEYQGGESLIYLEGYALDQIHIETMNLSVLSEETTIASGAGTKFVDLEEVTRRAEETVHAMRESKFGVRPYSFLGARHYGFEATRAITNAFYKGGGTATSTDIDAIHRWQEGMGTIPHSLEAVMGFKYGYDNAVKEALRAFHKVIDPKVPRLSLADWRGKELDDSLAASKAINGGCNGHRLDTNGKSKGQGALSGPDDKASDLTGILDKYGELLPAIKAPAAEHWYGKASGIGRTGSGVTITLALAHRLFLKDQGLEHEQTFLTSGMGNPNRVRAFVEAENLLDKQLFHGLGAGELAKGGIFYTCDFNLMSAGPDKIPQAMHKIARPPIKNDKVRFTAGPKGSPEQPMANNPYIGLDASI